jgi:RNA polymerase sigma-70 factor (ECF subfamily)
VEDDEAVLLERLRAGDEKAFAELVAANDAALRRVARSFVRTAAAADEVVGETWLAVIAGLPRFEGRSSLRTWIFGILVNKARTRGVREARSVPFSALADEDGGPTVDPNEFAPDGSWRSAPRRLESDPEGRLLASELRAALFAAIDRLPPRQRTVLVLRDVVGLDPTEVSELLELSEGNQRVLLHRGRARLRQGLADVAREVPA